ncbi:hypothetical protein M426DRAFT_318784 [Hypoxylon sp. CI-4A]|nr:hypothetical protein M426DRAFT_318784 [Hypoxylon sp. CI-4A]
MKRIRFVEDRGDGDASKRKQVRRACDVCRKGKRKCSHIRAHDASAQQDRRSAPREPVVSADLPDASCHEAQSTEQQSDELTISSNTLTDEAPSPPPSTSTLGLTIPFTGPSSAHSLLLSVCSSSNMESPDIEMGTAHQLPRSRILRPSFQDMRAPPFEMRPGLGPCDFPMVVRAVLPYLEIECLQVIPPRSDLEALIEIFKQEIHPIMPIVDFDTRALREPPSHDNPATIVLRQAICIAACKSASARPYLNLQGGDDGHTTFHTPRSFADRLFSTVKISQDIGLVDDRIELVQVLALLSFHSYGPDGDEEVARLCGQAIHFAYSAGLHYPSRPQDSISEVRRVEILCSLFSLDRLIAMITGRPSMIRRHEICLPKEDSDEMKAISPGLAVLFRLCQMLDRVLDLYRARPCDEVAKEAYIWDASWPEFEDLAKDYKIQSLHSSMQACLELLYHVISVISYRPALAHSTEALTSDSTPSAVQNSKIRHKHSAQQISLLLSLEIAKLPFIPYAASLSLTVALRNLSQAVLESTRQMARDNVNRNIRLLERLADMYWHAESALTLGQRVFQNLS